MRNISPVLLGLAVITGLFGCSQATEPQTTTPSSPTPIVAASPEPSPKPSPKAKPSPRPPIPAPMLKLGEKTAKKVKASTTVWGTGGPGTNAMVITPRKAWEALSKTEKAALTYYAEASIQKIRTNAADHVDISPSAPIYEKAVTRVQSICDTCWVVMLSNKETTPYGIDKAAVQGEAAWKYASQNDSDLADRADVFRAEMLRPSASKQVKSEVPAAPTTPASPKPAAPKSKPLPTRPKGPCRSASGRIKDGLMLYRDSSCTDSVGTIAGIGKIGGKKTVFVTTPTEGTKQVFRKAVTQNLYVID